MYRHSDYEKHRAAQLEKEKRKKEEHACRIKALFEKVKEKWGLSKRQTERLLEEHTFTEILEGEKVGKKVKPKRLVFVDYLIWGMVAFGLLYMALNKAVGLPLPTLCMFFGE